MKPDPLVTLDRRGDIAIVSLNRPARHNALTPDLLSEMLQVLQHADCLNARVVILRAEGRSFSTGGDLMGFWNHRENIAEYAKELVGQLNRVILAIYKHPAVIVCSVHGQVTGGSLGFLLAADHVIMHRDITITPYYSVVGFSPDGGWTALLPDIIGRQQAVHWLASNASHDANTCKMLGLAQQVVENNCDAAARSWAEQVADKQSGSVKRIRQLLNTGVENLGQRLEAERVSFVSQAQTQQALDGIKLFLRRQENGQASK